MILMSDMTLSVETSDVLLTSVEDDKEAMNMEVKDVEKIPESLDYEDLKNKPSLNGKTISGDMKEIDPTVADWAKSQTRPVYNADDVGAVGKDELVNISTDVLEQMWNSI